MKRILSLVLGTVFIATFAATAGATSSNGMLEINAGYAKSSTELGVTGGDAPSGGVAIGGGYWRSASPKVNWGAEISYDNLGSVDYMYDDGVNPVESVTASEKMLRINPALRVNFGSTKTNFFMQGGAGYYSVSQSVEVAGLKVSQSDGNFGYNVGAGVGFPVGAKTTMNFQGTYNSALTTGQSTNYLAFRAGIGFNL